MFDREKKGSYLLEVESVDGSESARPGKHGRPNSGKKQLSVASMSLPGLVSENFLSAAELKGIFKMMIVIVKQVVCSETKRRVGIHS